jgi:hypothetical protein
MRCLTKSLQPTSQSRSNSAEERRRVIYIISCMQIWMKEHVPGQPGGFELNMVSLGIRAKTKISENEFRFSHSWYWILSGALFPRTQPFFATSVQREPYMYVQRRQREGCADSRDGHGHDLEENRRLTLFVAVVCRGIDLKQWFSVQRSGKSRCTEPPKSPRDGLSQC